MYAKDRASAYSDISRCGFKEARNDVQNRRLAAAGRAKEDQELPLVQC
ncbi:hypothetical protein Rumeso_01227 [Rubellimicrobium mesophilum DSM 19309]|uniref:Uncharacterized protein n=1 Tax=Rubellimicrobium mesophilum DSM 19309 TaxID=442562 RepID=A0A017HRR4_9RHOB|nr:hypothetical protein Rumeso_01227 [Rubellimicrobium mesophilum DSM 19309]